eukprot:10808099-Alexandrium_andersonii.AAC.1
MNFNKDINVNFNALTAKARHFAARFALNSNAGLRQDACPNPHQPTPKRWRHNCFSQSGPCACATSSRNGPPA